MSKQDPKAFVKKLRKSIDFDTVTATIPVEVQNYAETHADPQLVEAIRGRIMYIPVFEVDRFEIGMGNTLTITKKEEGLYSAFVSNVDGQVVKELDNVTVEILVKELELRDLINKYEFIPYPEAAPAVEAIAISSPSSQTVIRISLGDVQIEISKSLNKVTQNDKVPEEIRKALQIFRKSASGYLSLNSDSHTAQEILTNWNLHGEKFNQILFGVEQISKAKGKK